MSNINNADKFAECPHDCYDIRVNSYVVGKGAGRWYSGEGNGDGIQDIKDGSGYAKGYSECSNISLNLINKMKRRSQGIITYEGKKVYYIDNTLTIIESVHNNYAKGFIIKDDFSLKPCFIAKKGIYFAHGDTLREANADALNKYMQNMPIEDRIANFMKQYPKLTSIASNKDLFGLHGMLTGSCNFGRREFANSHNIDVENGKMTIKEFIDLTINSYGGDVINSLKKAYGYK